MKKGCFVKTIFLLTILVAAITYIIQNRFNDFLLEPSKKIIAPIFTNNFSKSINYVKKSAQKDSLINLVNDYINSMKDVKSLSDDSLKNFFDRIHYISIDSVITEEELNSVKKIIKAGSLDERSTKN